MANRITEGFDWFPTGKSDADRAVLWGANEFFQHADSGQMTPATVVTGRFGFGKALALSGSLRGFFLQEAGYVIPIGVTPATGFLGLAVYVDRGLPSHTRPMIGFYDGVSDLFQCSVTFEPNGVIAVWQGTKSGNVRLASSESGAYQEDEWFHCETKALIANSGGTVEVRINTVPKVQLTGADTQTTSNAYFDAVFIGGQSTNSFVNVPSTNPIVFDDLFVNDTTGSSNNDWAGNLRVKTQFMIANGATDNFTIGGTSPAATNWQSVLNQSLDDTKYVFSANVGDIDLYTPDPNLNAPLVRCVQVRMALRQDDATQRVGRGLLRIGGVNYLGSVDQFTNTTYTFYKERWQLSPATGVTFTGAEVNGLQAGVKVQA